MHFNVYLNWMSSESVVILSWQSNAITVILEWQRSASLKKNSKEKQARSLSLKTQQPSRAVCDACVDNRRGRYIVSTQVFDNTTKKGA